MKSRIFIICALLFSMVLVACGSPAEANFPTGKFIKSGVTNYGYIFNEDGTWSLFDGFFTVVKGTYSVDGNVYTETSNNGSCESNVSFTYTFDGTNLTFNYIGNPEDDLCVNRTWDFDNVTYTLTK